MVDFLSVETMNSLETQESPSLSPKFRILSTAKRLFYEQGYYHTGINQIIKESKSAKASFYDHYPSKADLGKSVIQNYSLEIQVWFRAILKKSNNPEEFVNHLADAILLQTRSSESIYHGCPVAIFSCQFPSSEEPFATEFRQAIQQWESMFSRFWEKMKSEEWILPNTDVLGLSRDLITLYEGALMNWRLSQNMNYLERMKESMQERIGRVRR
ncbi:TetR/AcrR family transcriptional regulator [Leptospira idonii]|nr:TetR/AcrR family transcriptional regulator [Leptospira idonii]